MSMVLIIEDEENLRETCGNRLEQEGFTVLKAPNGASGLTMALERQPDIILLDIHMPQMSGFEMLKHLRGKGNWGAHVPVIFLTNIEPSSDAEAADINSMEPADYLLKSNTSLEDVVVKVRARLGA